MWMTEKTIQKAVFPFPKTCRENRGWAVSPGDSQPPSPSAHHTHHAHHGEEDDEGQAGVGAVGAGVDVRVTLLVELQHAEPRNHVHEGGVWGGTAVRGAWVALLWVEGTVGGTHRTGSWCSWGRRGSRR